MNNFYKWFFLIVGSFFAAQIIRTITGGIDFLGVILVAGTTLLWLLFCIFVIRSSRKYRKQNTIEKNN